MTITASRILYLIAAVCFLAAAFGLWAPLLCLGLMCVALGLGVG